MREPNVMFPLQNRAAICITSTNYDRRALDCTDYLPIINSLTNLAYLTGSSPTIRDVLTRDGGLESLVTILKNTKVRDRKNGVKWTLAFQCVVNIGVRGTEQVRKRVVQAGMVPIIVHLLESFYSLLKTVNDENERKQQQQRKLQAQQQQQNQNQNQPQPSLDNSSATSPMSSNTRVDAVLDHNNNNTAVLTSSPLAEDTNARAPLRPSPYRSPVAATATIGNGHAHHHSLASLVEASQDPVTSNETTRSIHPATENASSSSTPQIFYSEDDILHALQLLAYLSKYPSLRTSFQSETGPNVFAVVEKFTHRQLHPLEIQYWAGVIMRNACRKDDSKGIRQCAYTGCGKWETKPREFAKCRRCRKAKYCSKPCQSKAWSEGHRWWCVEKRADAMGVSSSYGTDLPPAPPPPPPPADLQDQQPDGDAASLTQGGSIPSGGSGSTGTRMIGGGAGSSNGGESGASSGSSNGHQHQPLHLHQHQHQAPHHHRPHHEHPEENNPLARPFTSRPPAQQQTTVPHPAQRPQPSSSMPSLPHFQGPRQELRLQMPLPPTMPMRSVGRPQHQPPQRSMTHPNFSTAPMTTASPNSNNNGGSNSSNNTPVVRHLGVSPDSPTPEQLAQRFVQQVALYPGRHNELAQQLNAQFQRHFPPQHQSEAKSLFSFHAREHFARYQRQQDLLRSRSQGSLSSSSSFTSAAVSGSTSSATAAYSSSPSPGPRPTHPFSAPLQGHAVAPARFSGLKHGTARRRSDMDTDDEDAEPSSSNMTSSITTTSQRLPALSNTISVPMLTQDLTTSMSLHTSEVSGPPSSTLPTLPSPMAAPSAMGSSSSSFKVRKVMTREDSESSIGGSSSSASASPFAAQQATASTSTAASRGDGWSYSRQLAKDTPSAP
ncbi:hypothetical protein BGZ83_000570 [Gryganskiella cystojenkinii]|nr:hypothetical protein BGZ83_000570 [Gryganskiella cystojenkinii]